MGDEIADVPKAFAEVDGRRLYDRQREALDRHVDDVTVVLGYEHERVVDELGSANAVVVERWEEYDNAESLRRALWRIDDDALVLNGDVVVAPRTVERLLDRHAALDGEYNVVGCLPGVQDDHTAIRCDDADTVVEYGEIAGHRHAGIGVVSYDHQLRARATLRERREEWYPQVYVETSTKCITVSPDRHVELNRPNDLEDARETFPLERSNPRDAVR